MGEAGVGRRPGLSRASPGSQCVPGSRVPCVLRCTLTQGPLTFLPLCPLSPETLPDSGPLAAPLSCRPVVSAQGFSSDSGSRGWSRCYLDGLASV